METSVLKRFAIAVLAPLLLSACAGGGSAPAAPAAPMAFDPTGTWDVSVNAQGMSIAGTMVIEGSAADGYSGRIDTDMGGALLPEISVEGRSATFYVAEANATVILEFDDDTFTGEMDGDMGAATLMGTRRAGG